MAGGTETLYTAQPFMMSSTAPYQAAAATGSVVLAGTQSNTFTNAITVGSGVLVLDKTGGAAALASGQTLNIGYDVGTSDSAQVIWANNNQLTAANSPVQVNSTGLLNLNGKTDTVTALTMEENSDYGAQVNLAGGTMSLAGNLTVNTLANSLYDFFSSGTTGANSMSATIFDSVGGGALALGSATRTFTLNNPASPGDVLNELAISANMTSTATGTASPAITKAGTGTLLLSGNNTFASGSYITLSAGGLALASNTALGNGNYPTLSVTGASTIRADRSNTTGAMITVPNNITLNAGLSVLGINSLTSGAVGEPIIFAGKVNLNGQTLTVYNQDLTTFTGASAANTAVDLNAGATGGTISVASGSYVQVTGNIVDTGGTAQGLTKAGYGTLYLSGANTFADNLTISHGYLLVASNAALGATTNTVTVSASSVLGLVGTGLTLPNTITLTSVGFANADNVNYPAQTGGLRLMDTAPAGSGLADTVSGNITLTGTNFYDCMNNAGTVNGNVAPWAWTEPATPSISPACSAAIAWPRSGRARWSSAAASPTATPATPTPSTEPCG